MATISLADVVLGVVVGVLLWTCASMETLVCKPQAASLVFGAIAVHLLVGAHAGYTNAKFYINQRPLKPALPTPASSPRRQDEAARVRIETRPVNRLTAVMGAQVAAVVDASFGRQHPTSYLKFDDVVMALSSDRILGVLFTRFDPLLGMHVLERFCVLHAYRGHGIGSALLQFVHTAERWSGAQVLFVNTGAVHGRLVDLYERHDFAVWYSNATETCLMRTVRSPSLGSGSA